MDQAVTSSTATSLGWFFPSGVDEKIRLYLHPHDVVYLTSTSKSIRAESYRAQALMDAREIVMQAPQVRASMERDLPERVSRIYKAIQTLGSVPVISSSPTGTGYLFIRIKEMRSSVAITKSSTGQRGIVVLLGGVGAGSVEIPGSSWRDRPEMKIPVQSICSVIFLMESIFRTHDTVWQLKWVDNEVSYLEENFQDNNNLFTHPKIETALVSILSGSHRALALISPAQYSQRHFYTSIHTKCDLGEGCSLIIRGNGAGMDEWSKDFPMRNYYGTWCSEIRVCVGSEYKIFLKTPAGEFIPEDGPNHSVLYSYSNFWVPAPAFSIESLKL
jgi:hypothetical protein